MDQKYSRIIRIIISAYNEFNIAYTGINKGKIYKYIVKPWDPKAVKKDLYEAIDLFTSQIELYNEPI